MAITITADTLQPKDITINETGETVSITDSTATVENIIKDTLTLTLAGSTTNLGDLANVEISSVADGQLLVYESSSSKWKNSASSTGVTSVNTQTGAVVLDTDDIQEDGSPTNRYFTDARARGVISVTDAGGDGSLAYNSSTGVITYTGPTASEVRAHFTGGTGVTITDGDIAIGQSVGTTDDVTFAEITGDEFIGNLRGATLIKASAGEALTKGDVVYISGISGNTPVVSKADADDSTKMPAVGLANATVSSSANVDVLAFGQISNIDTTQNIGGTWAEGDSLYVNTTAGQLTKTQPTGETSLVQKIAKIEKVHASTGLLLIQGAGRTNATPNLDDGNIFIGNSSNYATTSSLDTEVSGLGYITASSTDTLTNKSGNISMFTNDAGYLTSETDSQTLSFTSPNLSISNGNSVDLSDIARLTVVGDDSTGTTFTTNETIKVAGGTNITTAVSGDTLTITGPDTSSFITASSTDTLTNKSGNISQWTNDSGYITASSTDTLTNKSGNISMFTNDSGYLTSALQNVSEDTTPQLGGNLDVNGNSVVSVSNGDITVSPDGTGKFKVTGSGHQLTEGTPGNHTNPLLHLKSLTQGYNKSHLKAEDSHGEIFDLVGRYNPGNGHYQFYITLDPSTINHPTGAFAGDKAYVFQYDSVDDEIRTDIFGAGTGAGHVYSVFGDFTTSYGYQDMTFRAKEIEFQPSGSSGLKVTSSHIDTQGLTIRDSSGGLTFDDNTVVDINSSGTVAFTTQNTSATGTGIRVDLGESSTAHTGGTGLEVRRGTGSGFQTQFKVETASSQTRTSVASALNLEPVAYASLHSSPTEGDIQFLTTDGASANKHKPIYYDGVDWRYFNDDSVVASS